jgi:hypothetical protein
LTERSGKPSNLHRDGDRLLQLLIFNEEYLVGVCHQRASITSLPFVHTARRSYRLNDPVRPPDCGNVAGSPAAMPREAVQTLSFRGRRSRNKVSVGEPAEGSLSFLHPHRAYHSTVVSYLPLCGLGFVPDRGEGSTLLRQPHRSVVASLHGVVVAWPPPARAWLCALRAALLESPLIKSNNSCRWISWHEQR